MDGRIGAVRSQLGELGRRELPIIAYSAKYASAFYGPFREAADSAPSFGDRRSYQMDPANADEAVREALLDAHGSDCRAGEFDRMTATGTGAALADRSEDNVFRSDPGRQLAVEPDSHRFRLGLA